MSRRSQGPAQFSLFSIGRWRALILFKELSNTKFQVTYSAEFHFLSLSAGILRCPHLSCVYLPHAIVPRGQLRFPLTMSEDFMAKKKVRSGVALSLLLFCLITASHLPAAPQSTGSSGYHLVNKVKLGGTGGWDYLEVDPATHRLFISRGTHVIVVDPDKGKIIGDIPNTQGVHGIALADEFNKGFTTNGRTSDSTVFDLTTLKVSRNTKTDKDSDAVIYDPFSKRVFTFNGDANTASAIDAASGNLVSTFPLGGGPEFGATDGKGKIFVNLEDKSSLVKFDAKTLQIENTWPLAPCESPSGLAIDAAHEILVVGCHNKLMAFVDGNSGKVLGTVPIGQGVDANRFDPATGYAFASCGDGTLTIAHEDSSTKFSLVEMIQTQRGARTMALDYATQAVYLVTAEFGPAPTATSDNPRPRPVILPDTFSLLIYGK
jgi:DNA-binding beta-propeller fold protein YncE